MFNYSEFKTVKQIISESPKLSDILLSYKKYLAHTPNEGLAEHTDLTLQYLNAIVNANRLDDVIDRIIREIVLDQNGEVKEKIKQLFVSSILFHDFGKVNVTFQSIKLKNTLFDGNQDSIGTKHSLLGSYIFVAYNLDLIFKEFQKPVEFIIVSGFCLLFSYSINNHHKSEFTIDFSKNQFEEYIDEFIKYLKTYNLDINSKFERDFFIGNKGKNETSLFILNLKRCSDFITKQNNNEFNLWCLLKLQYSLLTASDYFATSHYKGGLKSVYGNDEFGIISNELSKRMIQSFSSTKDYNQVLYSDYKQFLNINLSDLQTPSWENLCKLRQRLGAELIDGINRNRNEKVFYIEAPTGGGKTNLSMLAITKLLEIHKEEITKIFYVFPFTTLITQTHSVLKSTFNLTEEELIQIHSKAGFHSKKEEEKDGFYGDEKKDFVDYLFINYPVCLLSHIKFFSIIATNNKESNYILHRFANSIVVIDELQTYSPSQWDKLKYFISNYARNFNMRFIIMSATLPKIHSIAAGYKAEFAPLLENVQNRFLQNPNFRDRVLFDFSLIDKYDKISVNDLTEQVLSLSSQYANEKGTVHTIIEFIHKKSTTEFYDSITEQGYLFLFDYIFILSGTILEPRRKEIIDYLKDQKSRSKNILLITTQVVEAGVDIDMDLGFKNISLLDSDEQLAGRVNRNAKKERCSLFLFKKDEPSGIYKNDFRYDFSKTIYRNKEQRSRILENKDFGLLYDLVIEKINKDNLLDFTKNFQDYLQRIKNLDYTVVSDEFKLIDNKNISIFVPIDIQIKFDKESQIESFSEKDYQFLKTSGCIKDDMVLGNQVWKLYNETISDTQTNYLTRTIKLKRINGILSQFVFSMFTNQNLENDLGPFLEYNVDDKSFKINGYYCLNASYNKIYDYKTGLNEKSLNNSYFIF